MEISVEALCRNSTKSYERGKFFSNSPLLSIERRGVAFVPFASTVFNTHTLHCFTCLRRRFNHCLRPYLMARVSEEAKQKDRESSKARQAGKAAIVKKAEEKKTKDAERKRKEYAAKKAAAAAASASRNNMSPVQQGSNVLSDEPPSPVKTSERPRHRWSTPRRQHPRSSALLQRPRS